VTIKLRRVIIAAISAPGPPPAPTRRRSGLHPRRGDRIVDCAFERAARRWGWLTWATNPDEIEHPVPFGNELVAERAARNPAMSWDQGRIDALAASSSWTRLLQRSGLKDRGSHRACADAGAGAIGAVVDQ
jgi:hypothetical protein